jgi:ferredoxin
VTGRGLQVDPIKCTGHGICAELLPGHVTLDEWGYPIIADAALPPGELPFARRAVTDCPALALRLKAAGR